MKTLTEHEKYVINKAFDRLLKNRKVSSQAFKKPKPALETDYVVDKDHKFTVCILKNGKSLTVGSSKRCTYNGRRSKGDEFSLGIGKDIALTRAFKNYAVGNTVKI